MTGFPSVAVALLTHESCLVNGEVLFVAGGRVARPYVAETDAIIAPELTAETLQAQLLTLNRQTLHRTSCAVVINVRLVRR